MQKIFDSCNMLDEPELCAVFLSLVGGAVGGTKPYECIGTFSESSAAVELSVRQWRKYVSAIQLQNTSEPHDLPVVLGALARFIGLDSGSMTHASDDSSDSTAIILKWTSKDNGEKLSLNTTI